MSLRTAYQLQFSGLNNNDADTDCSSKYIFANPDSSFTHIFKRAFNYDKSNSSPVWPSLI